MIKLILSYLPVGLTLALIPNYPQNNPKNYPREGNSPAAACAYIWQHTVLAAPLTPTLN